MNLSTTLNLELLDQRIPAIITGMEQRDDWIQIGRRLRAFREAIDKKPAHICRHLGIGAHYWSQWEHGKARISLDLALRLCQEFDATLDWIYRGQLGGMSWDIAEKVKKRQLVLKARVEPASPAVEDKSRPARKRTA